MERSGKTHNAFSYKISRLIMPLLVLLFLLAGCSAAQGDQTGEAKQDDPQTGEIQTEEAQVEEAQTEETQIDETLTGEECYEKGKEAFNKEDYEIAYACFLCAAEAGNAKARDELDTLP